MTRLARICGSALLLGAFALAGDKKKTPPPEAKALLDGLGIQKEDTSPLYASPAEAKVNEGAVRLAWSTGLVMNTLTRDSTNLPGWVQLKNGERLEGKFSVKAKKNRRKPDSIWTFTEINFQAEASAKRKLAAAEVEDFGYNYKIADYYQQAKRRAGLKNPGSTFHPGALLMADGSRKTGLVVMWTHPGDGGIGHQLSFTPDEQGDVMDFPPSAVRQMSQTREGATYEYFCFRGGVSPATVNGKNFVLFKNPSSTTKATGFLAGLANMGAGIAADQAGKAVAKGQMKADLKNGKGLAQTAVDGQKTYNDIAQAGDLGLTKDEFVVRNVKTGAEVIVSDETLAVNVMPLIKACKLTAAMGKDEIKDLTKFKNIQNLVRTLDGCF